jgi:hypothetical protein
MTEENEAKNVDGYNGKSKAERATNCMEKKHRLGTDKNEDSFAVKKGTANPVALPIHSKIMAKSIKYEGYQHDEMLKTDDIKEVQDSLSAIAEFKGEDMSIWQRTAPLDGEDGVEIDLGGEESERAIITKEGVSTNVTGSETLFSHSAASSSLPRVAEKGDLTKIFPYLNMVKEHMWLLVAYLTYILAHPKQENVGYPILIIKGEQGSGKSFLCKAIIRALVDPNNYGIQMFPSTPREMAISAKNAYVLIYDNIRKLCHKWSDAMCVSSTGGFLPGRKLYSDNEEINLDLHGPKILNGIHNFLTEPDVVSRCVNIELLPIAAKLRKNEEELCQQLELDKPIIFRGLLDSISKCFAVKGTETITHPQRMMGFVRWLAAFELAEGMEVGTLQKIYAENQKHAMLDTIAEDNLAYAVLTMANEYTSNMWSGTPTALLDELTARVSAKASKYSKSWPQTAISLSKRLAVLKPSLLAQGVELVLGERGKERRILLGMEVDIVSGIETIDSTEVIDNSGNGITENVKSEAITQPEKVINLNRHSEFNRVIGVDTEIDKAMKESSLLCEKQTSDNQSKEGYIRPKRIKFRRKVPKAM